MKSFQNFAGKDDSAKKWSVDLSLVAGGGRFRRSWRRLLHRCRRRRFMRDRNVNNLHRTKRAVVLRVGGHARNLFDQRDGGLIALPEDGVVPVQVRLGYLRDEELRAIRSRAGVGVGQASGFIE